MYPGYQAKQVVSFVGNSGRCGYHCHMLVGVDNALALGCQTTLQHVAVVCSTLVAAAFHPSGHNPAADYRASRLTRDFLAFRLLHVFLFSLDVPGHDCYAASQVGCFLL
jgi:hypothetical protein